MRTNTLTLQDRLNGKCKRAEVMGIPALTIEQGCDAWNTHGTAAMHKLNDIRRKAGAITDTQFNRSLSRTVRRLSNMQYWRH